jgi:hypothetical protein
MALINPSSNCQNIENSSPDASLSITRLLWSDTAIILIANDPSKGIERNPERKRNAINFMG